MDLKDCDFSGWATKNNLECTDGLVIRKNAFKTNNGKRVPLVWNHGHDDPTNVLGHAILENREEGVYAYCFFNDTEKALSAKKAVMHGDIDSFSIWANQVINNGPNVESGNIREISLVIAGKNPGALIESTLGHGISMNDGDDECIIYTGEKLILAHAEEKDKKEDDKPEEKKEDEKKSRTLKEVYDSLDSEQKELVAYLVNEVSKENPEEKKDTEEEDDKEKEKEDKKMAHTVFDNQTDDNGEGLVLSHSETENFFKEAQQFGSLKTFALEKARTNKAIAHSISTTGMEVGKGTQNYGVNDLDMFFPDYQSVTNIPEFISRNMGWVTKVMSQVKQVPFTRIKSLFANITEDEARAKGYIKGRQKKEEVFTTLKRSTEAQMVYKRQKLDRQDIIQIKNFNVVAWLKNEMEMMLDEEIARAILIGDGRPTDSEDKISESNIRPIAKDVPLFNTVVKISGSADQAETSKATIDGIIRSRKKYKGSGKPTFWTTEDVLTEMLLLEDGIGHKLYKTEEELATALRVAEIVTVEPMEGATVPVDGADMPLLGIIVNLVDYAVGTDSSENGTGEKTMFDDFDINFNQYIYLIEAMKSGALVKPFSALTIVLDKE